MGLSNATGLWDAAALGSTPNFNAGLRRKAIRKKLKDSLEITKGCRLESIMKDNHTIGNNPQNVIRWIQIAKEEAERIGA